MKQFFKLLILIVTTINASALTLAWDPSPDASVSGYRIYASTNSVSAHGLTNALVKIDCKTNLTCSITDLKVGRWFFVATAYAPSTNGTNVSLIESLPSNEVVVQMPPVPPSLRTVDVQWLGDLATTNWTNVGYFRLKINP